MGIEVKGRGGEGIEVIEVRGGARGDTGQPLQKC
jgi:hypothetical protein